MPRSLSIAGNAVPSLLQRNRIHAWDMRGRPSFSARREFNTLELPRGTVLEVELVPELTGEVRQDWAGQSCHVPYIYPLVWSVL